MPAYEIAGKVALVTGAARGIGFATARALIARGASVTVVDLDEDAARAAAAQLHDTRALGLAADVTDRGAVQRAVAATVERFGALDVLVANAGVANRVASFRAMPSEAIERTLGVNLMGVYLTVEAALPEIVPRRGHVVVISSIYAFTNGAGEIPYAMSKAAVEQLGRGLRSELSPHGASATVAYFGFIDTEMVHQALDEDPLAARMIGMLPGVLHKRLKPEVAGAAIAQAIERRSARLIRPRRWAVLSVLRGILGPLGDARMQRDAEAQQLLRDIDARAGEDQPTTA
ncbi:MAG TPA: SDR family NAD(P)-dependent oxidoreductase [Solirubrobacteraceae bacterium]|nr:SDR family NAD(P)-dependent oxidoreductase [Solirubrobacteraceae bacterium]